MNLICILIYAICSELIIYFLHVRNLAIYDWNNRHIYVCSIHAYLYNGIINARTTQLITHYSIIIIINTIYT